MGFFIHFNNRFVVAYVRFC